MRILRTIVIRAIAGLFAVAGTGAPPVLAEEGDVSTLALTGATIIPSPGDAPVAHGVVLVHNGRIVAVGAATENPIPSEATRLDVDGLFVLAGFQNSHVHFTETKWENAAKQPAAQLSAQLEDMLLRWGATTVVDTGSLLSNTLALRARIESGEVRGPRIYTVGTPIYPHDGIPFYLRESLPAEVLPLLPTPQSGTEAAAIVMRQLEAGADALKLFTGSWVERGRVLPMDAAVARTAADTAHERGKLVFAHASNIAGLEPALEARVNVLAHALDDDRGWNETHVARMKAIGMAMIPTLKLFGGQNFTRHIQAEVGTYAKAGGQILFGTDAGYLTDYDTTDEFTLMAGAGLDWRAILASLTTAPAERFGETLRRGRVAAGLDADLVVLGGDPSADVTAFASVRYTIRGGRVVYAAPTKPEDRSRFAR
jgi:imidazolonepropionase-like amidohydrolase